MDQTRPPAPRTDSEREPPDVRLSASRCPYCHEDVARELADVCRDCLARHHAGCWGEGGARCGACGSGHVLRPVRPTLTVDLAREHLLARGYTQAEVDAVVPWPLARRCVAQGCARPRLEGDPRGVLCEEHARASRSSVLLGAGLMLALGVLLASVGVVLLATHDPKAGILIGIGVGAALVAVPLLLVARRPVGAAPPPGPAPADAARAGRGAADKTGGGSDAA